LLIAICAGLRLGRPR